MILQYLTKYKEEFYKMKGKDIVETLKICFFLYLIYFYEAPFCEPADSIQATKYPRSQKLLLWCFHCVKNPDKNNSQEEKKKFIFSCIKCLNSPDFKIKVTFFVQK